ncbi:hypothetical protein GCM10009639_49340 [Kitasatospora putterlickiae]|uniref:Secreted protein n=1 Tax=Kitasatospora putterlickiae TaxID=221725 RepID=A0ABN1YHE2_9ACTN
MGWLTPVLLWGVGVRGAGVVRAMGLGERQERTVARELNGGGIGVARSLDPLASKIVMSNCIAQERPTGGSAHGNERVSTGGFWPHGS